MIPWRPHRRLRCGQNRRRDYECAPDCAPAPALLRAGRQDLRSI